MGKYIAGKPLIPMLQLLCTYVSPETNLAELGINNISLALTIPVFRALVMHLLTYILHNMTILHLRLKC